MQTNSSLKGNGILKHFIPSPLHLETALDATFKTARSSESNVGNLIADIIRRAYETEIGYFNGGAIRADDTLPPKNITLRDILNIFPFEDPCIVTKLTGKLIWETLENGVSLVPKLDGRFPQISGMRFVYDPSQEPGKRVTEVYVQGHPIDLNRTYTVGTRSFLTLGRDGYTALAQGEIIRPDENCHMCSTLLRNFFWAIQVVNRLHEKKLKQDLISSTVKRFNLDGLVQAAEPIRIAPQVEGRIMTVDEKKLHGQRLIRMSSLPAVLHNFADINEPPPILASLAEEETPAKEANGQTKQ